MIGKVNGHLEVCCMVTGTGAVIGYWGLWSEETGSETASAIKGTSTSDTSSLPPEARAALLLSETVTSKDKNKRSVHLSSDSLLKTLITLLFNKICVKFTLRVHPSSFCDD
ncbi:unnamed protein product [Protopolystoma xenopodis]|uniref:Uncharacterized protein n=1 Tax=Protopolystoma xenopodis TaxID=117903 RepID=A0A448WMT8_9PLAT|nr:unnamed protein product [Protopolystoma xenopodis]